MNASSDLEHSDDGNVETSAPAVGPFCSMLSKLTVGDEEDNLGLDNDGTIAGAKREKVNSQQRFTVDAVGNGRRERGEQAGGAARKIVEGMEDWAPGECKRQGSCSPPSDADLFHESLTARIYRVPIVNRKEECDGGQVELEGDEMSDESPTTTASQSNISVGRGLSTTRSQSPPSSYVGIKCLTQAIDERERFKLCNEYKVLSTYFQNRCLGEEGGGHDVVRRAWRQCPPSFSKHGERENGGGRFVSEGSASFTRLYFEWIQGITLDEWLLRNPRPKPAAAMETEDEEDTEDDDLGQYGPREDDVVNIKLRQRRELSKERRWCECYVRVFRSIAAAVAAIHGARVVHGHLVPRHILLEVDDNAVPPVVSLMDETEGGGASLVKEDDYEGTANDEKGVSVKIIDFGKATVIHGEKDTHVVDKATSPKQAVKSAAYDDLHSLGDILEHMFVPKVEADSNESYPVQDRNNVWCRSTKTRLPSFVPVSLLSMIIRLRERGLNNDSYHSALDVTEDLDQILEDPFVFLHDPDDEEVAFLTHRISRQSLSITRPRMPFTEEEKYFHRPSTLYGRESELKLLTNAYYRVVTRYKGNFALPLDDEKEVTTSEAGTSEVLLVSGCSGSGKSFLVENARTKLEDIGAFHIRSDFEARSSENHQPDGTHVKSSTTVLPDPCRSIRKGNGFFVCGKFDQLRKVEPYSALIVAFTALCDQILGHDMEIVKEMAEKILKAVDNQGKVLTDIIPDLTLVIGNQDEVTHLSGMEARNRFFFLFRQFTRVVCCFGPLVLFVDDLQWADEASLDLLKTLVTDTKNKSLLVVGAYREEEVNRVHPLMSHLRALEARHIPVTKVVVTNLSKKVVNMLISDCLRLSRRLTWSLTNALHDQTQGNAFFVVQLLRYLKDEGLIQYAQQSYRWVWDLNSIKSKDIARDVVELMATKILKLPKEAQEVLKMAAGIGSYFDDFTLKLILHTINSQSDSILLRGRFQLEDLLKIARMESLITKSGKLGYTFAHDRIQQASYSLIPEQERELLHLRIGRILMKTVQPKAGQGNKRDRRGGIGSKNITSDKDMGLFVERIHFVAVDQLNRGSDSITDHAELVQLARLNLRAGERAVLSSAFFQAEAYFRSGIDLLGEHKWTLNYDLTAKLTSALAEVKYFNGTFDKSQVILKEMVANARVFQDTLRVHSAHILSLGAQSKPQEAVAAGFDVLSQLGEPFPGAATKMVVVRDVLKTKVMLQRKTDESLLNLATMEDEGKKAAMRILTSLFSLTYICHQDFVPLVVCRMMQLTLRHGACNETAFALSTYAMILSAMSDFQGGYRFALLSESMIQRFDSNEWYAHVHVASNAFCRHWREPLENGIDRLLVSFRVGMSSGDNEYAMYSAYNACTHSYYCGRQLGPLEEDIRGYCQQMIELNQLGPYALLAPVWQCILNLMGRCEDPLELTGDAMNEGRSLEEARSKKNTLALTIITINRMWISFIFGDYKSAAGLAQDSGNIQQTMPALFEVVEQAFFDGLSSFALAHETPDEKKWQRKGKAAKRKIKKWSFQSRANCLHKYLLLKAESSSLAGRMEKAKAMYKIAIESASSSRYARDEAIANERAGEFYLRVGDRQMSSSHIERARQCFLGWGAQAKAEQLLKKHGDLIVQREPWDLYQQDDPMDCVQKGLP